MVSRNAVPFLMVSVGCELLFLIEHRLREVSTVSVPDSKKLEILKDTLFSTFNEDLVDSIFEEEKLYTFESLKKVVQTMVQAPSLRINEENFEKLFVIICMSIKCQIVRCRDKSDFFLYCENQLNDLLQLFRDVPNHELCEKVVEDLRDRLFGFYDSLSNGEASRIRYAVLNLFRTLQVPVSVLIEDGYQAANGIMLAPSTGPSLDRLGQAVMYGVDGKVVRSYELPIAGKRLEDRQLELGRNRFSRTAVQNRQVQSEWMYAAVNENRLENTQSVNNLSFAFSKSGSLKSANNDALSRNQSTDLNSEMRREQSRTDEQLLEDAAGDSFVRVDTEKAVTN
mmetsp:Transcript_1767/g.3159  ORF Transcript_1767/g.3159 Transcript_1767/m.3159 type:complete len:339 (+) Transcript_1767:40-1056(+)